MIISKVYKGTTEFSKGYKGSQLIFSSGRLPSQYQEVEYIQSTSNNKGDNYIDTGYYPNANTSAIRLQFMFDGNYPLDDYGRLMGGYNNTFRLEGMANYLEMSWAIGGLGLERLNPRFTLDTLYSIGLLSDGVYINDVKQSGGTLDPTVDPMVLQKTIWLFSSNGGDRDGAYKLYSCQLEDNGVLVRDFVPCYIKATGEVGLYDLVTKEFYHNLGSVPFLKGGDI